MYPQKTTLKKVFKTILLILVILSFIFATVFLYFHQDYQKQQQESVDPQDTNQEFFVVEKNENIKVIAHKLKTAGLIQSELYFWWYLRSHNLAPAIQAGTHYLSKSYTYAEIAAELQNARRSEINLTIPEGYTIAQIDTKLADAQLINTGEFEKAARDFNFSNYDFIQSESLEGYLFPDTYRIFTDNFSAQVLIEKMLNNFRKKIETIYDPQTTSHSLNEVVIMASVIEKETRHAKNRPIVAGILWKRLDSGMTLGVDATIRYGLEKMTEDLTVEDLKHDSPYNTRKNQGLPPTAISNPGLSSLEAALHPEESTYFYYLHDAQGEIHYAETNAEHNQNRAQYL